MGKIKSTHDKLILVEHQIYLKYNKTIRLGLWAYIKYHIYINEINESIRPSDRINYISFGFIFKTIFYNILYVREFFKKDCWVFSSGRKTKEFKDKYLDSYSKRAFIFNYTQSKPHYGYFFLHHIKILIYLISSFKFYFNKESTFYTEILCILKINKINLNIDIYKKNLNIKIYEYQLWYKFWRLLFLFKKPKKIFFTSNNFFLPLIAACDNFDIKTYEIAHALVHKYHPSYSYNLKSRKFILPHSYIENNFSHNSNVEFPKDLMFSPIKKPIIQKKLPPEVCILIDQPGYSIESLLELGKELNRRYNLSLILIKHPLTKITKLINYSSTLKIINFQDLNLNTPNKNIVIGYSSNLIIELYYNGFFCVSIDPKYFDVFRSREEDILLAEKHSKIYFELNKLFNDEKC